MNLFDDAGGGKNVLGSPHCVIKGLRDLRTAAQIALPTFNAGYPLPVGEMTDQIID